MMDFLVTVKEITLNNGLKLKIKRPGVGYFYRLLWACYNDFEEIEDILKIFVIEDISKVEMTLIDLYELINKIIEFNSVKKKTVEEFFGIEKIEKTKNISDEEKKETLDNLEQSLIIIVDSLSRRGWPIRYILEKVNNIQCHSLMYYEKENEINNMLDMACAHWGGIEERASSIRGNISLGMLGGLDGLEE